MIPIRDRFENKLEDTIYEILFPKELQEEYKEDNYVYGLRDHETWKLTEKIKEAVLELIPEEILKLIKECEK